MMRVTAIGFGAVMTAMALAHPAAAESIWEIPTAVGPVQPTHATAATYAKHNPGATPTGSNNFGCRPTAEHPHPIVLAHGTDASAYSDYSAVAPMLADAGFCVFALNYGGAPGSGKYGTEDMRESARQVGEFVHKVLAATGASKVDLVGYSQGATVTRYFTNRLGGAAVVDRWLGVASPSYGGVFYGVVPLIQKLPDPEAVAESLTSKALSQQMQGSEFLTELNKGGDTVPGVRYTTIGSRYDEVIQPYTNVALRDPGATNLVIQDLCPQNATGHFNMVYDPFTLALIRHVLAPQYGLGECQFVALGTGIPEMVIASNF